MNQSHLRRYGGMYIIILLVVVSRLPQLLSPHLILDGDECVVGLMAKHFTEGKDIPFFFYGQQYGFAFIEVLAISVGYLLVGISGVVVKLSVLALWIVGVLSLYRAMVRMDGGRRKTAFIAILLLVLAPTWAAWSMKARGGYITAFMLSSVILWLLSGDGHKRIVWLLTGVLSVFIFYSQPLWLPGLLPFVVYALLRRRGVRNLLWLMVGMLPAIVFFIMIRPDVQGGWHPHVFAIPDLHRILITDGYIVDNMTGYYYLQQVQQAPWPVMFFVYVFITALLLTIVVVLYRILLHKQRDALVIVALCSLLANLAYLCCVDVTSPRYALPFFGYALLFLFIVYRDTNARIVLQVVSLAMLLPGVFAVYGFGDRDEDGDRGEPRQDIVEAVAKMKKQGVAYVYCAGPLLQWKLAFYSREAIIPRYLYAADRYMPYVHAVDSVYKVSPGQIALFGNGVNGMPAGAERLNNSFYILQQPDKELLKSMSFDIR